MVTYAALRFAEDANIADRAYWYRCPFPVKEGDRVFAPVGSHDRLQRAVVERVTAGDEAHAPYDVRFLKTVAAKCGAYRRLADGVVLYETGGIPYDGKHFTRFGRVLFGGCDGTVRGMTPVRADSTEKALRAALSAEERMLFVGERAHTAAACLVLLAGASEAEIRARLVLCGCDGGLFAERVKEALSEQFSEWELVRLAGILR